MPSGFPVVLGQDYQATPPSPQRDPSPVEVPRYLDYCSGRPGAGLSRTNWQKIGLIDSPTARRNRRVPE